MTLPLAFINYLLEDFGDEWVTKYMFHYRWYFKEDAECCRNHTSVSRYEELTLRMKCTAKYKEFVSKRQIDRLWVVGSNDDTANFIDFKL